MNEFLVNAGYLLMLCGFLVPDILWLRSLLISGQVSLALYGWGIGRMPMVFWNSLFFVINLAWVLRIIHERRPVKIPNDLVSIYEKVFRGMSPQEFLHLWETGRDIVKTDEHLVRAQEMPSLLMLMLSGTATVSRRRQELGQMERGTFIADMSFLTGKPASADVIATGAARVRAWSVEELRAWKDSKPQIFMKLQGILGAALADKLRSASLQLELKTLN